jgi:hypothetical protein
MVADLVGRFADHMRDTGQRQSAGGETDDWARVGDMKGAGDADQRRGYGHDGPFFPIDRSHRF